MVQTNITHTATAEQIIEIFVWTCLNQQIELEFEVVLKKVSRLVFGSFRLNCLCPYKITRRSWPWSWIAESHLTAVWQKYNTFHYHISNTPHDTRRKCEGLVSISVCCNYFLLLIVFILALFSLALYVLHLFASECKSTKLLTKWQT